MHLAINGSDLGRQRGGNESFILGLLQGFGAAGLPVRLSVITSPPGRQALADISYKGEVIDAGPYRRIAYHLWQQERLLRRLRPDWYFSTYFLPLGLPCRGAVIVHDVSFRAHPEYFPRSISSYMHLLTSQAIRQAQVVAFDSHYTASEVARYYPAASAKGVVTYPGVDERYFQCLSSDEIRTRLGAYGVGTGYLLAIGNIHPRKNLDLLLQAYRRLKLSWGEVPAMLWIGPKRWYADALVQQAAESGVIMPGYVDQADLPAFYQAAKAFVYPSLYEGFGLPVLEAMASGVPVIASDTTSLPEAAGNAALLIDPQDSADLANAIFRVVQEPGLAEVMVARGLAHARQFTYARTAQTLYQALLRAQG